MRIALVIEQLDQGGAERVVQRLARGLAERGQRVFVYCLRAAGTNVSSLSAAGVTSREARSPWADWRLPLRLGTWLRRDGVEVVHAHSCAAFVHALPAARMLGLPVIHVWHGWPLGRATREHRLARALDRHAACVAINSESLRPRLPAGRIRARAICVPNGIDLPPVEPAAARADLERLCGRRLVGPTFLSIANLRPEKDICGLLHAIARLRRTWPAAVLVCVGAARDDEYVREMLALRRALGLDRAVLLPGTCADAWRLLAGADVFCLSSRTESLPNVVLEAMSQGVPIVATRVGDVPRMLGDGAAGLLVPPADPSALAAALDAV
ncbi:MAG: glycosyltransferase, partial [Planctomycetota bacterium]